MVAFCPAGEGSSYAGRRIRSRAGRRRARLWPDDPARRELLMLAIRRIDDQPCVAGATGHMPVFGRRSA
jgi:hypothetical protein